MQDSFKIMVIGEMKSDSEDAIYKQISESWEKQKDLHTKESQ
jgi:hypothetical protein